METTLIHHALKQFVLDPASVIEPVDPKQPVELPEPWQRLALRLDDDLCLRARAFKLLAEREDFVPLADEVLRLTGEGFLTPFDRRAFEPKAGDPFAGLKLRSLDAVGQLSRDFGERVSATVWQTLAFMMTRPDPMKPASILSQEKWLPLPWWYADAVLHALGKVYGLFLHVQSRINEHTGLVVDHNCDCNHAIQEMDGETRVRAYLPPARRREATAAFLSHLFSETVLICRDGLPFNLGLSPEAAEILSRSA